VLALLLAADRTYPRIGGNLAGGVCDELAHLLTGALVLIIHFGRELGESNAGLSLLWPWTRTLQNVPHWSYLVLVCGSSLLAAIRGRQRPNAHVGGETLRNRGH